MLTRSRSVFRPSPRAVRWLAVVAALAAAVACDSGASAPPKATPSAATNAKPTAKPAAKPAPDPSSDPDFDDDADARLLNIMHAALPLESRPRQAIVMPEDALEASEATDVLNDKASLQLCASTHPGAFESATKGEFGLLVFALEPNGALSATGWYAFRPGVGAKPRRIQSEAGNALLRCVQGPLREVSAGLKNKGEALVGYMWEPMRSAAKAAP